MNINSPSLPLDLIDMHSRLKQAVAKGAFDERGIPNLDKIEDAAKEFEAVFLSEMIRPMFEGLEVDPLFGGGRSEEIFRGMMIEEYGKTMANAGGIGLASYVKAELLRIQQDAQQQKNR